MDKSVSDKVVQRMARFYGIEADQMYPELQMFNQFKLHIKTNLILSLFVSWVYLQKRIDEQHGILFEFKCLDRTEMLHDLLGLFRVGL